MLKRIIQFIKKSSIIRTHFVTYRWWLFKMLYILSAIVYIVKMHASMPSGVYSLQLRSCDAMLVNAFFDDRILCESTLKFNSRSIKERGLRKCRLISIQSRFSGLCRPQVSHLFVSNGTSKTKHNFGKSIQ